jgi:hypothetical protein
MTKDDHPSFLDLDQFVLGRTSDALAHHLQACAQCRSYVDGQRRELPLPAWLGTIPAPSSKAVLWFQRWRSKYFVVLAPALAAASLVFMIRGWSGRLDRGGVAEKGGPAVSAFVKHGERVFRWDGRSPIAAGDSLRLAVAGAGYRFISVAALTADAHFGKLLFEGAAHETGTTPLPVSWRVDREGAAERISVIVSPMPVSAEEHRRLLDGPEVDRPGVFRTVLTFPKKDAL